MLPTRGRWRRRWVGRWRRWRTPDSYRSAAKSGNLGIQVASAASMPPIWRVPARIRVKYDSRDTLRASSQPRRRRRFFFGDASAQVWVPGWVCHDAGPAGCPWVGVRYPTHPLEAISIPFKSEPQAVLRETQVPTHPAGSRTRAQAVVFRHGHLRSGRAQAQDKLEFSFFAYTTLKNS